MRLNWILFLLPCLVGRTIAQSQIQCLTTQILPTGPFSGLDNIATPTAFTMTLTFTIFSCTETSVTTTLTPGAYVTANVNLVAGASEYAAQNSMVFSEGYSNTEPGLLYSGITFPALTVTQLTAGQILTVEWEEQGPGFATTGTYNVLVPDNAITASPSTSTLVVTVSPTSSSTTSTTTSASSSSSSSLAGPIAGGVVGGVVVIGLLAALFFFCTRRGKTRASHEALPQHGGYSDTGYQNPNTVYQEPKDEEQNFSRNQDFSRQRPDSGLRYPEESANTQGNY